ncbi:MAG: S41 family peptidase [candidate division Zixibacteria bacterium]|nr:S41 family peptidase [candidate division Zixibacteria bacterium]
MRLFRKVALEMVALAVFAVGLIWLSGSGVAKQTSNPLAETLYTKLQSNFGGVRGLMVADTMNIDATESQQGLRPPQETPDNRETLLKYIKLFDNMAYQVKNRYMEDIDSKKMIYAGIRGMLQELDPFSVLMEEDSYDRLMESTHGKYEGLGMQIDARDDHIRIVSPIEGTPAYQKGLQAGDVIWEINGISTYKMTTADAAKQMRGTAGTIVKLKIHREGVADLLDYDVERAVIEMKSVNYAGYFPGTNIGYVRLSRFAEETGAELKDAINDLKNKGTLDGLVFDLRSNGGGLLQQAVETSNLFLNKDKLVVYTRGRTEDSERRYFSTEEPLMPDGKLIILVDEGTASASEIVSGAIQDWDRGLIMGQTTYGKGLVQQIFPAGDEGVALKLTTAKYYIPSGRCIQKQEHDKKGSPMAFDEETGESMPPDTTSDTLNIEKKEVFMTTGGRVVYGGGGIIPDVQLDQEKWNPIEINLERQSMFFDFAVRYTSNHPEVGRDLVVTDEILEDFKAFLKEKKFDYKSTLEASLDKMKEVIKDENKEQEFTTPLESMAAMVAKEKDADFERSKDYIKRAIKRDMISKLFGQTGLYEEVILKTDPDVQKALQLLQNNAEYSKLMSGDKTKKAEL